MPPGESIEEYREVGENMRYWGNMRFVSMTVFIAIMAGLITALFQWGRAAGGTVTTAQISIRLGGVLVTLLFWVMDERFLTHFIHFLRRGVALEKELGFQQYSTSPPRGIFTARNAGRLLYLMFLSFWIITLIWYSQF
jgi:hypothetical protein